MTLAQRSEGERVCAIVLNWRTPELTLDCLRSLVALDDPLLHIVCCDNGSQDGSAAILHDWASEQPTVRIVESSSNRGFAGGVNFAIDAATSEAKSMAPAFDAYWLLNSDTRVDSAALKSLREAARRPDAARIAAFGSTVVDARRPDRLACAGGFYYRPTLTTTRMAQGGVLRSAMRMAQPRPLDAVCGAAMWIRAAAWRDVGPLSEDYFLYSEDLDWSQRALARGWTLSWVPESTVWHHGAASSGGRRSDAGTATRSGSALASFHESRSALLYTRRHHPLRYPLAWSLRLAFKCTAALLRWRPGTIAPTLRAYVNVARTPRCTAASNETASTAVTTPPPLAMSEG